MSGVFYGGIPIEQVDFEAEFDKEIAVLEKRIKKLKERKKMGTRYYATMGIFLAMFVVLMFLYPMIFG